MINDAVWIDPLFSAKHLPLKTVGLRGMPEKDLIAMLTKLWTISPRLVLNIADKNQSKKIMQFVTTMCRQYAFILGELPEAFPFLMHNSKSLKQSDLTFLYYWKPIPPITAICLSLPDSLPFHALAEYRLRSLDSYPPEFVFFYVP